MAGDAPFQGCSWPDFDHEPRLNLGTRVINHHEERLAGKACAAQDTPNCGNGSFARYKVIHTALRMIANLRFR
jgi:hypothetical protein